MCKLYYVYEYQTVIGRLINVVKIKLRYLAYWLKIILAYESLDLYLAHRYTEVNWFGWVKNGKFFKEIYVGGLL